MSETGRIIRIHSAEKDCESGSSTAMVCTTFEFPSNSFLPMRTLLVAFLLTALAGCSTSTDVFTFDCAVKSTQDDGPLAGVAVVLKGQRISGGSFNPNYQTLGTATTDGDGRFVITVDKDVFNAYSLQLAHPQHFATAFAISPDDVPYTTPYSNTFALRPKSWVTTRVVNTQASQRIDLTVNGPSDGCDACCDAVRLVHDGEVFDTTFTCQMYGAELLSLTGNYRNMDGATVIISEQHATVAFDTLYLQLTY